ncbi:uncharacterized protein LOC6053941 [Culex quinquefasciatus]|uniref:uncharacterized protein LOC6053941 n=1 Tax=Culex quinquefasciatus TaxID=7176 RepID=UPI0018E2E6B3|nr:uncharacterized protein LOC6053941 [Culex quinquefasciatus]
MGDDSEGEGSSSQERFTVTMTSSSTCGSVTGDAEDTVQPYNRELSNISAGAYRCKANLSRASLWSLSLTSSGPVRLQTPVIRLWYDYLGQQHRSSSRPATAWTALKITLVLNRYYQLQSGSLLMADVCLSNAGRQRRSENRSQLQFKLNCANEADRRRPSSEASNRCLMLCYKNVNHDVVIRGVCYNNLAGLLPFTLYKAFIRRLLDFETKQND